MLIELLAPRELIGTIMSDPAAPKLLVTLAAEMDPVEPEAKDAVTPPAEPMTALGAVQPVGTDNLTNPLAISPTVV